MEEGEGSNAMASALRHRTINSEPSMCPSIVSFIYMRAHAIVPISITCYCMHSHAVEAYSNYMQTAK